MLSLDRIVPTDRRCVTAAVLLALTLGACSSASKAPRQVATPKPPAPSAQATQPAPSAQATQEVLAKLETVATEDLEQTRGGFLVNGFEFSFAATIATTVAEATGRLSGLSTTLSLPSTGTALLETTAQTSTDAGAVTTLTETQHMTRDQATAFLNNLQVQVATAGTVVSQNRFQTAIQNTVDNASISHAIEMTIDVHNFTERFQSMRQALDASAIAARMRSFDLGR